MLQNAPTLAIVSVHTEENEPPKVWKQIFHYFNTLLTFRHVGKKAKSSPRMLAATVQK